MTMLDKDVRPCLSDDEIERLHAFELDHAQREAVRRHIEECPACAARCASQRRSHDTWIDRLRSVGKPPPDRLGDAGAAAALRPDSVAGYEIHGEIARGGQGVVYRATQISTRREVALKVLRDGAVASADSRRRFQREIELVAGLRHPSIVGVYDSGVTSEGRRYYAMEFIKGKPLRRAEADAEADPVGATVAGFAQVCEAVGHAHQRGVIHRDLKPSNILVDDFGVPHVLDFGLARAIRDARDTSLTLSGQVAGTLQYMSPEQARGHSESADTRTDVYALGVILYELLTGQFPYSVEGDTFTVLRTITETSPTPPRRQKPLASAAIDDELETIVLKALEKEPDRRYQSAGEFARDLRRYLAGEPIDAKRDSGWYVLRKALARYRLRVAAAAAAVLVIAGAAVWLGVLYAEQSRLRTDAERRLAQVRDIAKSFIFEFDPKIRHLPGAAEARQLLVKKGLEYLDAMSREASGDETLRFELASAYIAIGDVLGDRTTSNLGEYDRAEECYRHATDILAELAGGRDADCDFLRTRAVALLKLGDVARGDPTESERCAEAAVKLAETRAKACPDDPGNNDLLADALQRLADQHRARGDREGSLALYQRILELAEADTEEGGVWGRRDMSVVLTRMAMLHYANREFDEAIKLYERFVEIARQTIAAAPDNLNGYRDAAVGYQWLGILRLESGHAAEAVEPLRQSSAVIRQMLEREVESDEFRGLLVITLTRLSEALLAVQDRDGARRAAAECVEVADQRAQRFPEDGAVLRSLAVAYYKQYEIESAEPRDDAHTDAACDALRRALDIFIDMRERDLLGSSDVAVPAQLQAELDACGSAKEQTPESG